MNTARAIVAEASAAPCRDCNGIRGEHASYCTIDKLRKSELVEQLETIRRPHCEAPPEAPVILDRWNHLDFASCRSAGNAEDDELEACRETTWSGVR